MRINSWIWKLHRNRKRKMMKWYEKDVKHDKYSTMFVQVLADVLVDPMSSRFVLKIGKAQQRRHVKARLVPGGWQRSSSPCGRWSWQWRVKIKRAYCWSMQFFDVSCNLLPLETWKMSTLKKWTWLTWQIRKYSSGINRYRWNLWFGELRHVPGHQPRVIMSHGFIWASETLVCCYHGPGEEFTSISRSIRIDTCILWSVVPHWRRPGSHPNAKTTPSVLRSFVPTWLHFLTSYDFMIHLIVDIFRFFSFSYFPVWHGALVICVLWLLPLLDRTSRDFKALSQAMGSVNSCETPVLSEAPVSKDRATWFNEACQTREHQFRNQRLYKNKQTAS